MTYQPLLVVLLVLCLTMFAHAGQYKFGIEGDDVTLNGKPFKLIGLRMSNALLTDETTQQLIDNLDTFKSYGVNAVSVFVMGSRFGDLKGYNPDGTIVPEVQARFERIIEAADERGMVVVVGCLYWGVSRAKEDLAHWTQDDADRAVANTVRWLVEKDYRNVIVDPDNEGMAHVATGWSIGSMIDAAHAVDPTIMVGYNQYKDPPANADILLHHSPKQPGKPWVDTEATPMNAPGTGYWHDFSKGDTYYNYYRLGRYTPEMKQDQFRQAHEGIDDHAGNFLASTWLQAGPHEGIGGPRMIPGGRAENPDWESEPTAIHDDAGILWWLEHIKERYGAWDPAPYAQ